MRIRKFIPFVVLVIIAIAAFIFFAYNLTVASNVRPYGDEAVIYIPDGSGFEQVLDSLTSNLRIKNRKTLLWVAEKKDYMNSVKPGRYVINKPLSYNEIINILRSGRQTPVKITFSRIRTLNELAGKVGGQIEVDSADIMNFLSDSENYVKDGFTRENVIAVFIPNTYEIYWNTKAGAFYGRMLKEYRKFWNESRIKKSGDIGLTPLEVSVLASIVDEEASKADEKPRIAGVYINRLKRGIPLQADPTIKFALNDFKISRILYKHLEIDSPYNTYKHSGLPPGPIGCPTIESLDAVLNAEKHDFLFFAAKPDFSGYHNFSRTLSEHNRNAREYQRELNRRRIFR